MNFYYDTEFLEGTQRRSFLGIPLKPSPPTIDLISIGIVAEDGREYYAISKEFNIYEAWNRYDVKSMSGKGGIGESTQEKVYWIRENVLRPIFDELHAIAWEDPEYCNGHFFTLGSGFNYGYLESLVKYYGKSRKQIAEEVKEFCSDKHRVWVEDADTYVAKSGIKHFTPEADMLGVRACFDIGKPVFYGYYADYDHVAMCWLFGKMMNLPDGFPMYTRDLKQMLDEKPVLWNIETHVVDGKLYAGCDPAMSKWSDHPAYPKQTNEHNALADARWNKKLYEFIQIVCLTQKK